MTRAPLAIASLSLLLLTGCAAAASAPADTAPNGTDNAVISDQNDPDATRDTPANGDAIAHITSCDTVATAVQPYIQELVEQQGNIVDEWGVTCGWTTAENETDWANVREVAVGINPDPNQKPDPAALAGSDSNITPVDDAWVANEGGVAYTMSTGPAVAGVTVTTIWLPYAEVMVTGGTWGDYPALAGHAAVSVAKQLLG